MAQCCWASVNSPLEALHALYKFQAQVRALGYSLKQRLWRGQSRRRENAGECGRNSRVNLISASLRRRHNFTSRQKTKKLSAEIMSTKKSVGVSIS